MLTKWLSNLFRSPAALSRDVALPYLGLLAYIARHPDEVDTHLERKFGRQTVLEAADLGLVRWQAPSLPDYELYRLTRLGRATLKAGA